MYGWLILAMVPALSAAAAVLPDSRFEASGGDPRWKLRIEQGKIALEHFGHFGKDRYIGRVATVERTPGRFQIAAMIDFEEAHPIGMSRNGRPIVTIETGEAPIAITVSEEACAAKGRSFPTTVRVDYGDAHLRGCGGPVATLKAALVARP